MLLNDYDVDSDPIYLDSITAQPNQGVAVIDTDAPSNMKYAMTTLVTTACLSTFNIEYAIRDAKVSSKRGTVALTVTTPIALVAAHQWLLL